MVKDIKMIGLLGSGSWATAIVKILLEDKDRVINWWVREPEVIDGLLSDRHNPLYLREAFIDTDRVHLSSDIRDVVESSSEVYVVIPSAFVNKSMGALPPELMQSKYFISATKGIIPETNQVVTEYLHSCFGIDHRQMAVCIGPTHAEETAQERLSYLKIASPNEAFASKVRMQMKCKYVKTGYSNDMLGLEYSAVLKNIYAIAVGMAHGLGYGDNLIAVLVTNAIREGSNVCSRLAPNVEREPYATSILGDMLVTCYSQHSRNRTFGAMIGRGYRVKDAQLEMNMVAEGYYAVACIEKTRREIQMDMPIVETVYKILYEKGNCRRLMRHLLENME